jgi:type II secretory pathway pseudopilin PulG
MTSRRRTAGFTIIEAVAAIVMLALIIPPTMYALREAHIQRVNPVMASRARWLATERLENIIADRHSTTRGYTYLVNANYPAEASIASFAGFTRSTSITETGPDLATSGTGYKRATVTVSWTDATGTARALSISTIVTDYPAS